MRRIGFRIAKCGPSFKLVLPMLDPRLLGPHEVLVIDGLTALPDSFRPSEIRDAAPCGNARARKYERLAARAKVLRQLPRLLRSFHGRNYPVGSERTQRGIRHGHSHEPTPSPPHELIGRADLQVSPTNRFVGAMREEGLGNSLSPVGEPESVLQLKLPSWERLGGGFMANALVSGNRRLTKAPLDRTQNRVNLDA